MIDPLVAVNIIANFTISFSMILFYILLFTNENGIVNKWKAINHWTLKIGLVTVIASAAWNTIENLQFRHEISTPIGEVILNVGLAVLFCWLFYFHKYQFMKAMDEINNVKKPARTVRRRKPAAKTVAKAATKK